MMTKELRFAQLEADETSTAAKSQSHTNNTDSLQYIRRIDCDWVVEQANTESMWEDQLSKSAAYVNEEAAEIPATFRVTCCPANYAVTAPTTDACGCGSKSWTFARGQLTLEPGESLHTHTTQGTVNAGTKRTNWIIAFEY